MLLPPATEYGAKKEGTALSANLFGSENFLRHSLGASADDPSGR